MVELKILGKIIKVDRVDLLLMPNDEMFGINKKLDSVYNFKHVTPIKHRNTKRYFLEIGRIMFIMNERIPYGDNTFETGGLIINLDWDYKYWIGYEGMYNIYSQLVSKGII